MAQLDTVEGVGEAQQLDQWLKQNKLTKAKNKLIEHEVTMAELEDLSNGFTVDQLKSYAVETLGLNVMDSSRFAKGVITLKPKKKKNRIVLSAEEGDAIDNIDKRQQEINERINKSTNNINILHQLSKTNEMETNELRKQVMNSINKRFDDLIFKSNAEINKKKQSIANCVLQLKTYHKSLSDANVQCDRLLDDNNINKSKRKIKIVNISETVLKTEINDVNITPKVKIEINKNDILQYIDGIGNVNSYHYPQQPIISINNIKETSYECIVELCENYIDDEKKNDDNWKQICSIKNKNEYNITNLKSDTNQIWIEELQLWIEELLNIKFEYPFFKQLLRSTVLCDLLNTIKPGICCQYKKSERIYVQKQNITIYLTGCRALGIHENYCFLPTDLVNCNQLKSNQRKIVNNLIKVQFLANKLFIHDALQRYELDDNTITDDNDEKEYPIQLNINKQPKQDTNDMMSSIPQKYSSLSASRTEPHCIWSPSNGLTTDEKRVLADTHYDTTQAIIQTIQKEKENKSKYALLNKATQIEGCDRMEEKDLCDDTYWDRINNAVFKIRLDFDYDEWMKDKDNYQERFINEVAEALKVEANGITVNDYRRGSLWVDIKICNISLLAKSWYKAYQSSKALNKDCVREMRVQDQISVEYKGEWYDATITVIIDDGDDGKKFQVRYNPLKNEEGKDPFWWNNEWFSTKKEEKRLRFNGMQYYNCSKDDQGQRVPFVWKSPSLASSAASFYGLKLNDHLFVKFPKNKWRRCMVVKQHYVILESFQYNCIQVKNLMDGQIKNLKLWQVEDVDKISFKDMRIV